METKKLVASLRVSPGERPDLGGRDPGNRLGLSGKAAGTARLERLVGNLRHLQKRLWAESTRSLLLVLQGLDASGKDGTISHVLTGVNPQGCRVVNFRAPTALELGHDYLHRVHAACPSRGEIGIFDRSHYEDVIAARVRGLVPRAVWKRRFRHIREFERLLSDEGTTLVKVFLNVSHDEQARRLQERLDDPEKSWKFRLEDLDDRLRWDDYLEAYEDAIAATSTDWAPWYVVPADHNWIRNLAVAELLVDTLRRLDPRIPEPDPGLQDVRVT